MKQGRPTKINQSIIKELQSIILNGNYIEVACKYVGIDKKTFYNWLKRGEKAKSGLYKDFFHAMKKAESATEIKFLQDLLNGEKGWQSKAWFLERRFSERWGRDTAMSNDNKPSEIIINPVVYQSVSKDENE